VLRGEEDGAVGGERFFQSAHRAGPADLEGDFGEGEDDDVADRNHRQARDVGRGAVRIFFHKRNPENLLTEDCEWYKGRASQIRSPRPSKQ
jgi:hypothetical protein